MRFNAKSHRFATIAGLATLALAIPAPAGAQAAKGAGSMSDDEIYSLTCGHLGVPCSSPKKAHKARSVRKVRSVRKARAHVRSHR
jgi:hypothetical protein